MTYFMSSGPLNLNSDQSINQSINANSYKWWAANKSAGRIKKPDI